MPSPDWIAAPYVRVYSTLARDHPAIWSDLRTLGGYVRLLMRADQSWPGPAELPRSVPDDVVSALVADEAVDLIGHDLYRIHGLDTERKARMKRGAIGGIARAQRADRDPLGRFAGESLDETSVNAENGAGPTLGFRTSVSSVLVQRVQRARPPATPARP